MVADEKVTINRSGITTSRYRQIEITPTSRLTGQQREFLLSAGAAVGATVVERFPSVRQRIGTPATGLSSFPKPHPIPADATLEELVTAVFTAHLDRIVRAVLDRLASDPDDVGHLNYLLWQFGRDLRGLASVLEPTWRQQTENALTGLPFATAGEIAAPVLDVVEALIVAVRAPLLGDLARRPASRLLFQKAEQATFILADRCRALTVESPDDAWLGALRSAEQLEVVLTVSAPLMPKERRKMAARLGEVIEALRSASLGSFVGEPELDGLGVHQAYQLGRETERKRAEVALVRADFVRQWPERFIEARKLVQRARKKQDRKP